MESLAKRELDSADPSSEEVLLQLHLILTSPEFRIPERGRRLLQYVVSEKLAGRQSSIKAFTIAQDVCGRTARFDAQNDPVVRIEAGRLRKELERYYLTEGRNDGLLITIPKGCYVPHFGPKLSADKQTPGRDTYVAALSAWQPRSIKYLTSGVAMGALLFGIVWLDAGENAPTFPTTPRTSGRLVLGVEQFVGEDAGDTPRWLTDAIIGRLFSVKGIIVVVSRTSGHSASADGGPAYSLQGRVGIDGTTVRGVARLVRNEDGAVVWADDFQADTAGEQTLVVEDHLVDGIVDSLAGELSTQLADAE
jgi:TolB-like protein